MFTSDRVLALNSWHADWQGLRVAVLGLGVTGFSVADTLQELGCQVLVIANKHDSDREKLLQVLGIDFACLPDAEQLAALQDFAPELVIVSPGYLPTNPLTTWAAAQGVPVWGDVELAWRVRDKFDTVAEWVLVTGTNGKTTTTQLTAHIVKAAGKKVAPVGNIGVPVLDAIRDPAEFEVLIVELSSFQLHWLGDVAPWASVVLNIDEDHIDWHGDFAAYAAAKAKIYEHTKVACVYNRADKRIEQMVENADVLEGARAISFGLDVPYRSETGLIADPETGELLLIDRTFNEDRAERANEIVSVQELRERDIAQPHMLENILAATALARSLDISPAEISQAVLNFAPDRHRAETVAVHNGVTWINDSKATNAHAADASLRASESVVWIVGGLLKGVDIAPLLEKHLSRLKGAVIIGADRADLLAKFASFAPQLPVREVTADKGDAVMQDAVAYAAELVGDSGTVLLAPAAASMDQFASYGDRGDAFVKGVRAYLKREMP